MTSTIGPSTAAALLLLPLAGCATAPPEPQGLAPPRRPITEFLRPGETREAANPIAIYDPFERTNRAIYKFNAQFDRYVYLPVVNAYTFVTPAPVRRSVSNFFNNLEEITTFTNSVLQGKVEKASPTLFRFIINSTVGLFGLFDPASHLNLPRQDEDFGQTLGYWGLGDGPYLVLPILGPSNLRDATGLGVDLGTDWVLLQQLPSDVRDDIFYDLLFWGLWPIDARYQIDFRYHSTGSPFEYDLVRYFITKSREVKIRN
ncbi:MAG TPA: VacJ family lipoprotein [Geminicoccus sp.]|uniref:MlaA family lipoprotein n=1 Tax=Geminicoccus sp. TaxID=2024832 RepID=UPI002BCCC616|nr:VacJ family lipoprotein [Geminicoccus sp.]HWL66890.1 VacJ family lipoprotein [Geminicoccus sp.]